MTSGTNWSNANLITITPDDKAAAKELDYAVETVKAEEIEGGDIRIRINNAGSYETGIRSSGGHPYCWRKRWKKMS